MTRNFKTQKGTELPLLNLRGKEYLEVKYRLVWFREEHPDWSIETEFVSVTDKSATARATIRDTQGRILSVSHKFENERGFPDFLEKAETGAIGRALALVGYGTQFCADELDEGNRIVDSPVAPPSPTYATAPVNPGLKTQPQTQQVQPSRAAPPASNTAPAASAPPTPPSREQLGEFQILFGKKYRGKRLKEIPEEEIQGYVDWLHSEATKKGVPLSHEVRLLTYAVEHYYLDERAEGEGSSPEGEDLSA